ncbi:MAG: hypothetical protein NWE97_00430 [Candidatus Bathyarchaeota archaeon]|nr:hypothetical protein [Candidatus Bathyarchaeota archaeon]
MLDSLNLYAGDSHLIGGESGMFPLAFSLFETGLLITMVVFVLLYIIVLVKLKPSSGEGKIQKTKSPRSNIDKVFFTERQNNPKIHHEDRNKSIEVVKAIKEPKPAPTAPAKTRKTDSRDAQSAVCPYHYGYLKTHPKNKPIPNECLTCSKIMECLVGAE